MRKHDNGNCAAGGADRALLGLSFSGIAVALDDDNIFAYVITAVISSVLCIVLTCGLEALIKARGT